MRRWKTIFPGAILVIALTATSFVSGYAFDHFSLAERLVQGGTRGIFSLANPTLGAGGGALNLKPLEVFWEVLQHVRGDYVEPLKDDRVLTYGAVKGMLAGLDDPYTRFLDPEAYRQFSTETRGEFGGIGAVLGIRKGENGKRELFTVVEIIQGGPADKAGVKPGDTILRVDGQTTAGITLEDTVRMIRGPKGTKVTLTLARQGVQEPLEVSIVREMVEVPVVEHKMLEGNVGYLALKQFNDLTAQKTDEALNDLDKKGMKALIIDLRNNPGGLLNSVLEVASDFVKDGPIVLTKERRGEPQPKFPDAKRYRGYDLPVAVLVNHMSASGSEILSAALQQYGVAKLVGTTTFGKGLVQSVYPLSDGSAVLMTTAKYLTPDGQDINKKGVVPDSVVDTEDMDAQRLLSPDEIEEALKHLDQAVEETSKGREEARKALEKIRRALGFVSPPKEHEPDPQLEAARTLVDQELARRKGTPVPVAVP